MLCDPCGNCSLNLTFVEDLDLGERGDYERAGGYWRARSRRHSCRAVPSSRCARRWIARSHRWLMCVGANLALIHKEARRSRCTTSTCITAWCALCTISDVSASVVRTIGPRRIFFLIARFFGEPVWDSCINLFITPFLHALV